MHVITNEGGKDTVNFANPCIEPTHSQTTSVYKPPRHEILTCEFYLLSKRYLNKDTITI